MPRKMPTRDQVKALIPNPKVQDRIIDMLDELLKMTYATSFFNFISDHNSIVLRIGGIHNNFTSEVLEKIANEALSKDFNGEKY